MLVHLSNSNIPYYPQWPENILTTETCIRTTETPTTVLFEWKRPQ